VASNLRLKLPTCHQLCFYQMRLAQMRKEQDGSD
jgi:hypothetical protein